MWQGFKYFCFFSILVNLNGSLVAQYFGMNRPFYRHFDFSLVETSHFQIYHYFDNPAVIGELANMSERWYHFHQQVLLDTFRTRNPLIFYENHADFQQTTALMGVINVGVGGVAEGLKNRVIMPLAFTWQQTNHVLGHELVHAFQFNMLQQKDGLGMASIQNIPLWMIEGMAEYLSIGSVDANTAIWMRDALMHRRFPTLDEMNNLGRYSPYRFGQSFWAFISYRYGEQYIPRLFKATARRGYRNAIRDLFFTSAEELSQEWERVSRQHLFTGVNDSIYNIIGNRLVTRQNGGRFNLSPSASPDGKRVIFLSERDVYGLDLFLADATTGVSVREVFSPVSHVGIDALDFMESAGSWAPDNKRFAFVAYTKGRSAIIIYNVENHEIERRIEPPQVVAINSPAWSPDGRHLLFSGQVGLNSDLFLFNLERGDLVNLTNDQWAAIQPSWSADGRSIWFVTDEPSRWQRSRAGGYFNIAELEIETRQRLVHFTFDGARNVNPIPTPDGKSVLFLSNRDGRRNLYSMEIATGFLHQVTDYPTGIMGLTELAPAMGLGGNYLFYTLLWNGEFQIIKSSLENLMTLARPITTREKDYKAARLMPYSANLSLVEQNVMMASERNGENNMPWAEKPIRPKFRLDYIGNMGAGIMTGRFGTGMAGSIEALFSDMLGRNLLHAGLRVQGQIRDFGGTAAFLNQARRLRFGGSISHIPYQMGFSAIEQAPGSNQNEENQLVFYRQRLIEDKVSVFSFWPLNRHQRLEGGFSYAFYSYRKERLVAGSFFTPAFSTRGEPVPAPPPFNVGVLDAAFVSDISRFGFTSPVEGHRLRAQGGYHFGGMNHLEVLFDYRKYLFIRPQSLAFRLYHHARYGENQGDRRLYRLFLGHPWLVRGYGSWGAYDEYTREGNSISVNQVIGSHMLVANAELRMPFTGPTGLSLFRSGMTMSELSFFIDAGVVWDSESRPVLSFVTSNDQNRVPVFSTGLSMRFNIFGMMVLETYYAIPFNQLRFHQGEIGFNLLPGF